MIVIWAMRMIIFVVMIVLAIVWVMIVAVVMFVSVVVIGFGCGYVCYNNDDFC